jgi:cytochrome c556
MTAGVAITAWRTAEKFAAINDSSLLCCEDAMDAIAETRYADAVRHAIASLKHSCGIAHPATRAVEEMAVGTIRVLTPV